jgi:hypothetical protein
MKNSKEEREIERKLEVLIKAAAKAARGAEAAMQELLLYGLALGWTEQQLRNLVAAMVDTKSGSAEAVIAAQQVTIPTELN